LKPRLFLLPVLLVAACAPQEVSVLEPLPASPNGFSVAPPRLSGFVGTPAAGTQAQISVGHAGSPVQPVAAVVTTGGGDVSLEFAETDIREVVAQILGTMLRVNYTIDPAVHGSVTLRTAAPLARSQLIPVLETLLSQSGATMVQSGGLYRVLATSGTPGLAVGSPGTAGSILVPLRYAQAEDLAKALQPYVGTGGHIVALPGSNSLLVGGDPDPRNSLLDLIRAFDVDELAGQSYALLPVATGGAHDFATQLQDALRNQGGSGVAGQVRVEPLDRVDAVLIVASRPGYIEAARRIYRLVEAARRSTVRSWYVYYLQNSRSNDIANVLQRAFTPNNVVDQPTAQRLPGSTAPGLAAQSLSGSAGAGAMSATGANGASAAGAPGMSSAGGFGGSAGNTAAAPQSAQPEQSTQATSNPLLGGLGGNNGGDANADTMRVVSNPQNNAVLVYGTRQEEETVVSMLRKIDIMPLQVRIDATVAEVTLNDTLQYGTQYYFKQGGLNGALAAAFDATIPGFYLAGGNSAQAAITALQAVTKVQVLSSPQLLVLDNQAARLQVGDLVPYLTTSSQSTLTAGSPVINSIAYQQTGVVLDVTPRVNGGGLVTLDISQEVSAINTAVSTPGITSPAFSDRTVHSRVVVQDGQTIGLAGLIQDSVSRTNTGFPLLKDIPVLSLLFGQQNNSRNRTELLILVTPHVLHDQRDARDLTQDLREHLAGAATTPAALEHLTPTGSPDPMGPLIDHAKVVQ
jgi:general secretion pathway protein D